AILWIFLAAQSPELVVNDIRHHVLPLYFSRPISRFDYAIAKLAALSLSLLVLTLVPVLVLLIGTILSGDDLVAAMGDELPALPGIVGNGVLHAVVLASIGLAISSIAGRRAYAAGGIVALFLIGGGVSGIFQAQGEMGRQGLADIAPFFSPLAILDGAREWLFGETVSQSPVAAADVPRFAYGIAAAAITAICWAVLAVRYRRVAT
ncbi:MAG TPA: ABC transporter permease subunit, partial [Candidatus Limnocylindria bacterium]|nr:ABC transporter permease subunit [Candidatus Limnocylindria bacterium]